MSMKLRQRLRSVGFKMMVPFVLATVMATVAWAVTGAVTGVVAGAAPVELAPTSAPETFICMDVTDIPYGECVALYTLYNDTNGPSWTNHTDWGATITPCSWYGVTCQDGHVTKLKLENNQLSGAIPPQLGDLPELFTLYLYENELTGGIPTALGTLTKLDELILFSNALSGSIPPSLGNLTQVRFLLLNGNELTGEIPAELGNLSSVLGLYFQENHLSGTIPPALGNLSTVETLMFFDNQLSGVVPPEFGNLSHVQSLYFQGNQLGGLIPSELMQLGNNGAVNLALGYNSFTATDPALLAWLEQVAPNWQETQTVPPTNLAVSAIAGNQATITWTPIPYTDDGGYYEISYATQAHGPFTVHGTTTDKTVSSYTVTGLATDNTYYIRVRTFTPAHSSNHNDLWSDYSEVVSTPEPFSCANVTEIPQSECAALVTFYNSTDGPNWSIQNDWLTSSTPCSWDGLSCESSHVTVLKFDNSGPKGELPPQLEQLTYLRELYIGADVGGTLPVELGNLSHLEKLILPWNRLTGSIPPELGKLQNLKELVLVDNNLSGPIPPELGDLSNLEELHIHVNQFTGGIPQSLANLSKLRALNLGLNQLTGPIPPELGNLSNLQYLTFEVNQLEGNIPASLGNLHNLKALALQLNQFRGEVPPELAQLTAIEQLNVDYNALTATDPALLTWLDIHASEWAKTQTVPPTNLMPGPVVDGDVVVTWTPIQYTENLGFYEISYGTSPAGPFLVHGVTVDKTVSSYTITELSPDTTYYIRIRTKTAQPSYFGMIYDLWSDYSEAVQVDGSTTPTNLLQNGDFETGTEPWIFYTTGEGTFTTAGPAYAGNAAARIEIIETGNNTQLYQTGFVLEPRTRYRLTFAAYSSSGHDLSLYVHQHKSPYTTYGLRNLRLNLSQGWQTFSVEFRTKNLSVSTDDTRLRLWFKPYATSGDIYWIDELVLEKIDGINSTSNTVASNAQAIVDTITGTVQLPAGMNMPVEITLIDLETDGATFTQSKTTAADGTFSFADLPAGTYELRTTAPAGLLVPEPYQFMVGEAENEALIFVMQPVNSTLYLPLIER